MTDQAKKTKEPNSFMSGFTGKSYTIKALGIGLLLLLFLIPLAMMDSLLGERENRRMNVEEEILYSWGGMITLAGPILEIPYIERQNNSFLDDKGQTQFYVEETRKKLFLIPMENTVDLELIGEKRSRSIYTVPLYRAEISMDGYFDLSIMEDQKAENIQFLMEEARIIWSASDISGLNYIDNVIWNDNEYSFNPDTSNELLDDQVAASVQVHNSTSIYNFQMNLKLQGGRRIYFYPSAQNYELKMHANWEALSFVGRYLPYEHQQGSESFVAQWNINYLSANIPALWYDKDNMKAQLQNNNIGIAMVDQVSPYLKNERAQKYGLLFLLIPFLTFFLFEVIIEKPIHSIQYIMAGLANIVFYLLLLSLSEHWGFNWAYLIAATSVTLLLSFYGFSVFKRRGKPWVMPATLGISYFYLFSVLQSEDYALLLGSIGLLLLLALLMKITSNVDWYKKNL